MPPKIITAPTRLSPRQRMIRDCEMRIQRVYALGDTITFRQRTVIIRNLLDRLLTLGDTPVLVVEHHRVVQ